MLRIRQKRRVVFANAQSQPSSSKSAPKSTTMPSAIATSIRSDQQRSRHTRNDAAAASRYKLRQPPQTSVKVSNRQRRLASLFMAFMASSPLPIETDAETLEAAQKASIAPKTTSDTKHKQRLSIVCLQEVKVGRWGKLRHGLSRKARKGKAKGRDEVEMDDLVGLQEEEGSKGSDMI